ncbi:STAS domain-containing protein [Candidatus Methanomassiliicoccus intestinalis]|uniref:STAS domain-containing protein n=1 Tax=Candidatus Methanomassiliicoccus intestinalis TaxID=1406512 RepID=UPI0037DD6A89
MNVTNLLNGDNLLLSVEGRLDTITHQDFEKELEAILSSTEMTAVNTATLDFTNLEYISSAGLRAILKLQKTLDNLNVSLAIIHPNELVSEVLSITGIDQLLKVD